MVFYLVTLPTTFFRVGLGHTDLPRTRSGKLAHCMGCLHADRAYGLRLPWGELTVVTAHPYCVRGVYKQ